MNHFLITSEALGVVAQIHAVLLLATAFDPTYRRSVGTRRVVEKDTNRVYTIPVTYGRFRLRVMTITCIAIAFDTICTLTGIDMHSGWVIGVALLNAIPLGGLITQLFFAIYEHAHADSDADPQGADK